MKTAPSIGARVKYTGTFRDMFGSIGTVTKIFYGDGEYPDSACIEVDERPENWPYPNTNKYAPEFGDIELI